MLDRVLEPELMDTPEEALAYDVMDHREVNRIFVDDLLEALGPQIQGASSMLKILDLGAGTAQIPIELCHSTSRTSVVAVDAADHMLQLARRNIEVAGLNDRITLLLADAKQSLGDDNLFDCVMSNSIIHHLPEPLSCLTEAIRATKPGGRLFFRDLVRPESEAELDRLVELYAPHAESSPQANHQRLLFAASLHAALTLSEVRDLVCQLGFLPQTVQPTSDRHWTWSARK